jgi:hypothetical protein
MMQQIHNRFTISYDANVEEYHTSQSGCCIQINDQGPKGDTRRKVMDLPSEMIDKKKITVVLLIDSISPQQ